MAINMESVKEQVQHNCDISNHAYMEHFRITHADIRWDLDDQYRHENNVKPWESTSQKKFDDWIDARYQEWKTAYLCSNIERPYKDLEIGERTFSMGATSSINRVIAPEGHFYYCGLGEAGMINSMLGRIRRSWKIGEYDCYVVSKELARNITMSSQIQASMCVEEREIFAREEPKMALVWERVKLAKSSMRPDLEKKKEVMLQSFKDYGLPESELRQPPRKIARKLNEIAENEIKYSISHELGHVLSDEAGAYSEEAYKSALIASIVGRDRELELDARAVSDVLAETMSISSRRGRLAHILEERDIAALGFHVVNMFPPLDQNTLLERINRFWSEDPYFWERAYWEIRNTGDWGALEGAIEDGLSRAMSMVEDVRQRQEALDREYKIPELLERAKRKGRSLR